MLHRYAGMELRPLALPRRVPTCAGRKDPEPTQAEHKDGFWDLGGGSSVLLKDLALHLALAPGDGEIVGTCRLRLAPVVRVAQPFRLSGPSGG